mgnify:FL=1
MKIFNHALIMAAGRGLRMMPLTAKKPKAMAKLNGNSLIGHNIYKLSNKIKNIHITVGYKNSILASHVISKNVSTVINTSKKDNCWWVYNSLLKNLNEPVLVLTCDNIVDLNLFEILKDYKKLNNPHCMIISINSNKKLNGDYLKVNNKRFVKSIARNNKSKFYASGIQVLNPKKINNDTNKVDNFYDLWSQLIKKKLLLCSNIQPEKWCEIDTIKQLKDQNKKLK